MFFCFCLFFCTIIPLLHQRDLTTYVCRGFLYAHPIVLFDVSNRSKLQCDDADQGPVKIRCTCLLLNLCMYINTQFFFGISTLKARTQYVHDSLIITVNVGLRESPRFRCIFIIYAFYNNRFFYFLFIFYFLADIS